MADYSDDFDEASLGDEYGSPSNKFETLDEDDNEDYSLDVDDKTPTPSPSVNSKVGSSNKLKSESSRTLGSDEDEDENIDDDEKSQDEVGTVDKSDQGSDDFDFSDSDDSSTTKQRKKDKAQAAKATTTKKKVEEKKPIYSVPESVSTNRRSSLVNDVTDLKSALMDALKPKKPKKVVVVEPPKDERKIVVVPQNKFHQSRIHAEQVVRRQLTTALKKIQVYVKENQTLLERLDKSESLEEFQKLQSRVEEQETVIETLRQSNKYLGEVQRNQEKMLMETRPDARDARPAETSGLTEVRGLKTRLAKIKQILGETRQREKASLQVNEKLKKKIKRLKQKLIRATAGQPADDATSPGNSTVLSGRGGDTFDSVSESRVAAGAHELRATLQDESTFTAAREDVRGIDHRRGAEDSLGADSVAVTLMEPSEYELEKSQWEKKFSSMQRSVVSQKSYFSAEIARLKGELAKCASERDELSDELRNRERQAQVQLALVKKLRITCEELKEKNRLLQQASDLFNSSNISAKASQPEAVIPPPSKPSSATFQLRPVNSARRIVAPKQGIIADDENSSLKSYTFLTAS